MARPKRNNADYFSHDAGMRNDPKVKALRNKYGCTGYSVWCMMLEVLTESDFFTRSLDEIEIEILSADFGIDADLFSEIIQYMLRLRLLQTADSGELLSQKLTDRLQPVVDKRRNSSKKGVSVAESTQSKVKESKVNKSKEDKDTPPSPQEVKHLEFCKKYFNRIEKLEEAGIYTIGANVKYDSKAWLDAIRLMESADKIEWDDIMQVAGYYFNIHINEDCHFQAYSLPSFRTKYAEISTRMKKHIIENPQGPVNR